MKKKPPKQFRGRKYNYPESLDEWENWLERLADDDTLKKFYRYLPTAKTKFEEKVIALLTDEMVGRGLL